MSGGMTVNGFIARSSYLMAFTISLVGTAISLYWSGVNGWTPCDLCWYQRICMFPTFMILTSGIILGRGLAVKFAFPFVLLGILISLYHYTLQMIPYHSHPFGCLSIVPCSVPDFVFSGWITPPLLALIAFGSIGTLLFIVIVVQRKSFKDSLNTVI